MSKALLLGLVPLLWAGTQFGSPSPQAANAPVISQPQSTPPTTAARSPSSTDKWPRTRAERTEYSETSRLEDVTRFVEDLQRLGAPLVRSTIGTSTQGRPIVLLVHSDPPVATASEARRLGKPVVYLQANIHGGEVEGKEAVQELLREWAQDPNHPVRRHLVVLMTPIYNVDGNETIGDGRRVRSHQNGPAHVGLRPNGQVLDLNRDCMKAESPEMRAVLEFVYGEWDPDVIMDLHTTNGTRHGFDLTYSPPLDPNTAPEVLQFTRDELLPTVRAQLKRDHGLLTFDYGNAINRNGEQGWYTFGPEPRYVTNYAGSRNRIGILSEATSFRPFDERVRSTRLFVDAVLREIVRRRADVIRVTTEADRRVASWGLDPDIASPLGVHFVHDSRGTESVPLEPAEARPAEPITPTVLEPVEHVIYDRFRAERQASMPRAYFLPAAYPEAAALLVRQGIVVERLLEDWSGPLATFPMQEIEAAKRVFQGHRMVTIEGSWGLKTGAIPAGSFVIRTTQPLALLAFHFLEPESRDGLAAWGLLERGLVAKRSFPVSKTDSQIRVPTVRVRPVRKP